MILFSLSPEGIKVTFEDDCDDSDFLHQQINVSNAQHDTIVLEYALVIDLIHGKFKLLHSLDSQAVALAFERGYSKYDKLMIKINLMISISSTVKTTCIFSK